MQSKSLIHETGVMLRTLILASMILAVSAVVALPAQAEFGIAAFDQQITANAAGEPFFQAGGHPYAITTEIELNSHEDPELFNQLRPDADVKDIVTGLPPGLFGNPAGISQCTETQLAGRPTSFTLIPLPECPISSEVGTIQVRTVLYNLIPLSWTFPLYNLVPPSNMPASFGFSLAGLPITLTGNVRNGGDFGVNVASSDISNTLPITGLTVTFWGTPADKGHDAQRCDWGGFGLEKPETGKRREATCKTELAGTVYGANADPVAEKAFLTIPVSCGAPEVAMKTTLKVDSWPSPGVFDERVLYNHMPPGFPLAPSEWGSLQGMAGCEFVPFNPSLSVTPGNSEADTPAGLSVDFKLPQEGLINPRGIATSSVKKTVVTFPPGVALSPSAAQGLGSCSPQEIGLGNASPPTCPESSTLGSVEIRTPLLERPLRGPVYLAQQDNNPFGSLIAIYLVVEGNGVVLKLAGRVELDPRTGQVRSIVENSPQLPFEELKVDFNGGPRAPLVNPHACGTYQTTAELTPWSGAPPVTVAGSFRITTGPEGRPCPTSAVQGFAPGFAAGTTNNQAGAFSPLAVTFSRRDGEQQLGAVTVKTPPGLLGRLSTVSLCGEPAASQGTCPASSEIGSLTVGAGAGPNPFYVTGGKVFLTTAHEGGEFGLSVVVPAQAGPFNLGTVVVRGSIHVDPVTTALTVTTDPLPTILDGIPLDLRVVNVEIDKPGFIFNPTNCDPMSLSGLLGGGLGGFEEAIDKFQVTNCGRLGFNPRFSVTTPSKTSRSLGAGLTARLTYPSGPQANIAKVKVDLPKQLPSRLSTLQKACPDAVFQANPNSCPTASKIGSARAITPILPEPLTGPVYFVSHGGEAFPDLVVALKGYGINFHLIGTTFISKGITSTSFKQVPDVPIGSFELVLPQGPNSALAANGNLCASKLVMPTSFIAQDGAEIHQRTPITTTGCPRHKVRSHLIKHRRKHGKK